jgi:hypothetical protein
VLLLVLLTDLPIALLVHWWVIFHPVSLPFCLLNIGEVLGRSSYFYYDLPVGVILARSFSLSRACVSVVVSTLCYACAHVLAKLALPVCASMDCFLVLLLSWLSASLHLICIAGLLFPNKIGRSTPEDTLCSCQLAASRVDGKHRMEK